MVVISLSVIRLVHTQSETTSGGGGNQVLLYSSRQFSAHPKSSLAHIDNKSSQVKWFISETPVAGAARNTRYRYNQIGSLDHKMADNCLCFLGPHKYSSSTITKLIKPRKTSNESYNYNLLNRINEMYRHDLFYLQQQWEAWLAPIYKQIQTTKSQLTQCTKY